MPKISTFYAYALRLMCLASLCHLVQSSWLSKDAAREIVAEYKKSESERGDKPGRGHDRRVATPFVSGDAFRELCFPHICEDANRCKFDTAAVKDGECIFIKSDLFEMFMTHVAHTIPSSYVTVSHNGDLSTPDGQTDANRIGMPRYEAMSRVLEEHQKGRLLAHYGQNLWWRNITSEHKAERERYVCVSVCVCVLYVSLSLSLSLCVCLCVSLSVSLTHPSSFSPILKATIPALPAYWHRE